jgi:hypothetical protein
MFMRTSTALLPVLAATFCTFTAFAADKPVGSRKVPWSKPANWEDVGPLAQGEKPAAPAPAAPAAPAPAEGAKPAEPAAPAPAEAPLDPKALAVLKEKKGQKVTVEGTIIGTGEAKSAVRRYLNFTKNFRESVSLVLLVSKSPEEFSKEKVAAWVNKKVRATGTLTEYNGTLQIEITKPDQLVEVK